MSDDSMKLTPREVEQMDAALDQPGQPIPALVSRIEHVEVEDPDDPMGMPAFGGPPEQASARLIPGEYVGYAHYDDGTEAHVTVTVNDDQTVKVEPTGG